MFNCEFCGKLFKSKWHLTEHSRVHTGDKPYSCEICGKTFAVSANYKRHHNTLHIGRKKQKHGVKHFKCDVCEKFLRSKWHLANHIRIHTGDKPYSCEICGKSFTEKNSLKRHQLTYNHGRHKQKHGMQQFNCDVCQNTFGSKRHLTAHVRIHTDDKPYRCEICGRSFTENRSLKRHHITLHRGRHKQKHGIKQFKCDVCQKSFRSIWHLTTHVRIHIGDQPFSCEICGRSFTENSGLKRHRDIHTGEFKL